MSQLRRLPSALLSIFVRHKRGSIGLLALAVTLVTAGCGTALRVSHRPVGSISDAKSVPGVPFYVKRARCRQEVVWLEPLYILTLAAMVPDKDGSPQSRPRGSMVLPRSSFNTEEVKMLMTSVSNGGDEVTVLANWRKVVPFVKPNVLTRDFNSLEDKDRILLGSSAAPVVFVDYTDQYYVNAKIPLAGSANVDAKVADDGSLSEASGQVESKTLETILGPVNTAITGALGAAKALEPGKIETFTLTVSVSGYRHTLARFVDLPGSTTATADDGTVTTRTPACPVVKAIAFGDASEYKREDLSSPGDNSTDKKPDTKTPKKDPVTDKSKDSPSDKSPTADVKPPPGGGPVKTPHSPKKPKGKKT